MNAVVQGDWAHKISRWHGRPFVANASISSSLPLFYLQFGAPSLAAAAGVPLPPLGVSRTTILAFLLNLSITWTVSGVNRPLLADVAPPNLRASTMALEWSLEM